MKNFLSILLVSLFVVSCTSDEVQSLDDDDTKVIPQGSKDLRVSIDYTPSNNSGKKAYDYDEFIKEEPGPITFPKKFTAYFFSNEDFNDIKIGDYIYTVELTEGSNILDGLPEINSTVYVTNFYKESENTKLWFQNVDNPIEELPIFSDEILIFDTVQYLPNSSNIIDFKLENTYGCYQFHKSSDLRDEAVTSVVVKGYVNLFYPYVNEQNNEWYYQYMRNFEQQRRDESAGTIVLYYDNNGNKQAMGVPEYPKANEILRGYVKVDSNGSPKFSLNRGATFQDMYDKVN